MLKYRIFIMSIGFVVNVKIDEKSIINKNLLVTVQADSKLENMLLDEGSLYKNCKKNVNINKYLNGFIVNIISLILILENTRISIKPKRCLRTSASVEIVPEEMINNISIKNFNKG